MTEPQHHGNSTVLDLSFLKHGAADLVAVPIYFSAPSAANGGRRDGHVASLPAGRSLKSPPLDHV